MNFQIVYLQFSVTVAIALFYPQTLPAASSAPKQFSTPEDAVRALMAAVKQQDTNALKIIFGSGIAEIASPEQVQAENELTAFGEALSRSNHLDRVKPDRYILETGEDHWPFPIPIVRSNNAWLFDTEAGKSELINRRVGRNELDAVKSVRGYVEAQREYASKDRDGDQVLEYAQKILSSPGRKDGLYWPVELDGEMSPLGPGFVEAQTEGYFKEPPNISQPFHGYFFKILTRQGKHAPGGAYDFIINGNMIAGFALIAWPADYGVTGVMTFIINQQGKAFQKDLGRDTDSIARKMKAYDPDPSWKLVTD
jgi:hypothetical protein